MRKLGLLFLVLSSAAWAASDHWVVTWASAQQQPRAAFGPPRTPAPAAGSNANAPAAAPPARGRAGFAPVTINNQTVRMVARTSLGGNRIRVHLSNTFGTTPLVVGAAHVALRATDSGIVAGSDRELLFGGSKSTVIPPGADMISDAVILDAPKLTDLAVSLYLPADSGTPTTHSLGLHTTYISGEGDFSGASEFTEPKTSQAWYVLSSIDVMAPANASAIVAFGDSITDGATSTPNTDRSWPSILAQRLAANHATANVAIVNQGISGNRVLGDGAGISALARFDHDVLSQPGVKWLMILEGINDMNLAARAPLAPGHNLTADDLIAAMKQMITRAHDHGIKVIGCTLTPFGNASDAVEAMRESLNAFIRTGGMFDAVVDFDKVIQDPANPRQFKAGYNNTDKLHPNDEGYKAMAESVDLKLFK